MARKLRVDFPGAIHHLTGRGRAKQITFVDDHDMRLWTQLLNEASLRYGLEIIAYCVMSNHYHVVLRSLDGNMSRGMQWLLSNYTKKFNRRWDLDGALFSGRFHSELVDDSDQFTNVVRYVHNNALDLPDVSSPEQHKWSSKPAYDGLAQPMKALRNAVMRARNPEKRVRRPSRNGHQKSVPRYPHDVAGGAIAPNSRLQRVTRIGTPSPGS